MHPWDKENTTFITKEWTFCYTRMPFELKSVVVTYPRLVNRMFEKQIGRNIEMYVDKMMVKTKTTKYYVYDIKEVFSIIRHYEICLNPKKCVFGIT